MTWYTGTCEIMAMAYYVNFVVKCVCYMGLRSNVCFMVNATLMGQSLQDGHY